MTLTSSNDVFNSVPAFDPAVMPGLGQSAQDWDTAIMPYWVGGVEDIATNTPEPTSTPSSTDATGTSTPSASGATTATATTSAGSSGTGSSADQGAAEISGVTLATDLLGASFVLNSQGTGTGSDTGTVQDVIIEPRIAKLQYVVVSLVSGDAWIPVPIRALGWDSTDNQLVLMVDASMLQNAPTFSGGQIPDTSVQGWDEQFSTYWSGGGRGTGSDSGSGTGTAAGTATGTATP